VLGEKLAVHMGSVNYGMAAPKAHEKRWFVFDERVMQGSLKCVRSTSAVSPWALAALSGDLLLEVGCACGVCSERLHVHPPHPSPHLTPNTHVTHPSHPIHATPYTYLARMHTHTHTQMPCTGTRTGPRPVAGPALRTCRRCVSAWSIALT
jgi:hypothetical protein